MGSVSEDTTEAATSWVCVKILSGFINCVGETIAWILNQSDMKTPTSLKMFLSILHDLILITV